MNQRFLRQVTRSIVVSLAPDRGVSQRLGAAFTLPLADVETPMQLKPLCAAIATYPREAVGRSKQP
ncbi:MAG: hypothetical protein ACOVKS_09960 [Aquimonas sp.]